MATKSIKPDSPMEHRNSAKPLFREYLLGELGKSRDNLKEYSDLISNEVQKLGLYDWAYTQLDLPDHLIPQERLGTLDNDYVEVYVEESLYEADFLLQHVKISDEPQFHSTIKESLSSVSFSVANREIYEKFLKRNEEFGYEDVCAIPITSSIDGSRCLLTVTSKGISATSFKKIVLAKINDFKALASVIYEIGIKQHKKHFRSRVDTYNFVAYSQPINLIATMIKYDLSVEEGAKRLGIKHSTATKHLKAFRDRFRVKTTHAAIDIAKKQGYI